MKKQFLVLFFGFILFSSSVPLTFDSSDYEAYAEPSEADIRDIRNYSIYGLHSVLLGMNVTVNSGNVGVHDSSSTMQLPSNAEVWIKDDANFVDTESAVVGDTVLIRQGSTIQNVFSNELQNDGTLLGINTTPLALPVVDNLPQLPNSVSGTTPVNVPKDGSLSLAPGQYGDISIDIGGTLILTGGIYNVTSIDAKKDSNIFIDTPSEIVIDDSISWGKGVFVGPSITSSITAKDIILYVKGNADINAITTTTDFGKDAVVNANIFAPNGEITMDKGTKATGSFIAKTVTIGQNSVITLDSSFNSSQQLVEEYIAIIEKLDNTGTNLDQTVITQELIDEINSDLSRIKEIVIELQNLGFDGDATATRIGTQMIGTVSFFDENTLELLFETQIPDGTLGIFTTFGLNENYVENGVVFTFDQLTELLHSSSVLVDVITNFDDDTIASNFVLSSISPFHPSTGNTFGILIVIGIAIAINVCMITPECAVILDLAISEGVRLFFDTAYPFVTITGLKFNDKSGDGIQNDPLTEPGLPDWRFTMNPTLDFDPENPFIETFSNSTGHFEFLEKRVPRYVNTIFVTETQQDNWRVTTDQGLIHEITFIPPPLPIPGQPPSIAEFPPQIFGNQEIPPDIIDGFESFPIGTQNPGSWTFASAVDRGVPATVEIGRVQSTVVNGGLKAYEIVEQTSSTSIGIFSVANLFQLGIVKENTGMSVDVLGDNLVGQGGKPSGGGVVGVIIRYNLDDGTNKSIGWRTASQENELIGPNKPVNLRFTDDGLSLPTPSVTLDDFAGNPSIGVWQTLSKNLRDEFNHQFTEDYDTNVVNYDIFLAASSQTSLPQSLHKSQGFYDNVSLTQIDPIVTINQPTNDATFNEDDSITFAGTANDAEGNDVTSSLVWTSSLNGQIGTGASFSTTTLSVGTHNITATGTNNLGETGSSSTTISVFEVWQYREHKISLTSNPNWRFLTCCTIGNFEGQSPEFRISHPLEGSAYLFKTFQKSDIEGKEIKVTWSRIKIDHFFFPFDESARIEVLDGAYDRSSFVDFPNNQPRILKGNGIIGSFERLINFGHITDSLLPDWPTSVEDEVTIFVMHTNHEWTSQLLRIQEIEIVGLETFDFRGTIHNAEVTGTFNDYGLYGATLISSP